MSELTGKVNKQYNSIQYYFQLRTTNEQLARENERLKNLLAENFTSPDTVRKLITDSIPYDSVGHHRKWQYYMAKVVANSVTAQENFVQLNRGALQGLKKDMGVIDEGNNVVGVVTDVSDNFSVVMSLLHKDSHLSGKLKKGGEVGTLSWDGRYPNIIALSGIPKSAKVAKGDTVITSGYSTIFPMGLKIGYIDEVVPEKSSNNFLLRVKTAANFYNLQYAYVMDNFDKAEMSTLMEKVKKQHQ